MVQTTASVGTLGQTVQVNTDVVADPQAADEVQRTPVSTDEMPSSPVSMKHDAVQGNGQSPANSTDGRCDDGVKTERADGGAAEGKTRQKGRKALIPKPWKKKNKAQSKQDPTSDAQGVD